MLNITLVNPLFKINPKYLLTWGNVLVMMSITMTKEQFKRLRLKMGYTQQQFGQVIGYAEHSAKQQVYAIEIGRTKLTKTRIALMKYILKIK